MTIRDYYTLTAQSPALVLSPKLLTMVGYEVPTEDLKLYAKLHENELKQEHLGWDLIPTELQQRFINDEQTYDDLGALEDADNQSKIKQKHLEQEYIDMVREKGGPHKPRAFWKSVMHDWIEKHPEYARNNIPYTWHDYKREYERIIRERNQNVKQPDSTEGGTK